MLSSFCHAQFSPSYNILRSTVRHVRRYGIESRNIAPRTSFSVPLRRFLIFYVAPKKFKTFKSGDRVGQAIGPPRPIISTYLDNEHLILRVPDDENE